MSLTLAARERARDPGAPVAARHRGQGEARRRTPPPRTSPPAGPGGGARRGATSTAAPPPPPRRAASAARRGASPANRRPAAPGGAASARAGGTDPDASEGPRRGNVETSRPSSEAPSRSFSAGPPSAGPPSRFCHSAASREHRSATSSLRLASSRCCAAWICVWSWYAAALKWYPTPRWYRSCVMSQSLVTGKTPKARASSRGRAKPEDTPTARSVRGARARAERRRRGRRSLGARTSAGSTRSSRASSPPSPPSFAPNAGGYVFETWLAPPRTGAGPADARASRGTKRWAAPPAACPGASSAGCSTESVAKYADARTVGSEWPVRADRPFRVSCAI